MNPQPVGLSGRALTRRLPVAAIAALALGHVAALAQVGAPPADAGVSVPHHAATGRTVLAGSRAMLPSLRYDLDLAAELDPIVIDPVDVEALLAEDATAATSPWRIGVNLPVSVDSTDGRGAFRELAGIGSVWSVAVISPGAQGLRLKLANLELPAGAELWVYGPKSPETADGPYQGEGPGGDGQAWSKIVRGEEIRVEYFLPADAYDAGFFIIEQLAHIYRGLEPWTDTGDGGLRGAGPCHNDVMCFPAWHPLHEATGLIVVSMSGSSFLCSGTLLNSLAEDETPYFLTANHCVPSDTVAGTATFYWFYQTRSCDGSPASFRESNHASLLFTRSVVDMSLLMVDGALPDGVTWAGWDTLVVPNGEDVACISHPAGDRKKISFGDRITHPFGDSTHYFGVRWNSGTIEGGSSGSGLLRTSNQNLIGVASHSQTPIDCTNPDGPSGYGKFRWFYNNYSQVRGLLDGGSDDGLEDNDTCATARLLGPGSYTGLVVKHIDEDWYAFELEHCEQLFVTVSHTNDWGDIDLGLYDACGGSLLVERAGSADDKIFRYTNEGDAPVTVYLRVYITDDPRNDYTLDVEIGRPGAPPPPTGVAATDGEFCDLVVVTWTTDLLATSYSIWRNTVDDTGTAEQIGSSTSPPFLDTTSVDRVGYFYWVKAHADEPCAESDFSTPDVGFSLCDEPACPGDLDLDGDVDLADLAQLLAHYGQTSGATYEEGDLDGDGDVDLSDLAGLLANYGACP